MRGIRDTWGLNMTCGASNVSFGMPGRHALNATFLPMAMTAGLTSAIMDARTPGDRRGRQGRRPDHEPRRVGHGLDRPAPCGQGGSRSELVTDDLRREGLIAPGTPAVSAEPLDPADGTGRVDLTFAVAGAPGPRTVRVPPGVTVFDSASWNGIAIDSTCGGHGTCHKCKIRVTTDGRDIPVTRHDERTFSPEPARRRLAAGVPGVGDPRPRGRRTAPDHATQGRHRRRGPAGDPATGAAEALRRARRADAGRPAHRRASGCSTRSTTSS